ncbi:hypothetical protein [Ruegeria sp.]|uniref:dioxygenase family protein n=1 Tax=Ruegeria sp. TaxID=1879320 RepID=UPI003B5A401C
MQRPNIDNDLVKFKGRFEEAGGEVFTPRGTITAANGHPLARHRIEFWQCDMDGNYMHPRDRRSVNLDQAFQGFGRDATDNGRNHVFCTI